MAVTVQRVRVFISSPGDVQEERARIAKVFEEINSTTADWSSPICLAGGGARVTRQEPME